MGYGFLCVRIYIPRKLKETYSANNFNVLLVSDQMKYSRISLPQFWLRVTPLHEMNNRRYVCRWLKLFHVFSASKLFNWNHKSSYIRHRKILQLPDCRVFWAACQYRVRLCELVGNIYCHIWSILLIWWNRQLHLFTVSFDVRFFCYTLI